MRTLFALVAFGGLAAAPNMASAAHVELHPVFHHHHRPGISLRIGVGSPWAWGRWYDRDCYRFYDINRRIYVYYFPGRPYYYTFNGVAYVPLTPTPIVGTPLVGTTVVPTAPLGVVPGPVGVPPGLDPSIPLPPGF